MLPKKRQKGGEKTQTVNAQQLSPTAVSPLCQAHLLLSTFFRLTRDIVHRCNFYKVTSHYVQPFAATNNLQSLGRKQICDQDTYQTQQTGRDAAFPTCS